MIIESPNKVKTIARFLPKDFEIISTVGHIVDLSSKGLGFNDKTLEPRWVIIGDSKKKASKEKIVSEIKQQAHLAKNIYLATDPDREGEAIAWHVWNQLSDEDKKKCKRITFNEITQQAVQNALKNPRGINTNYVYAQFTRRILDRMVGYKLSSLVQRTLGADSAGRVQSLALWFLLNRENAIREFKKTYWWTIDPIIYKKYKLTLQLPNNKVDKSTYKQENGVVKFLSEETALAFKQSLNNDFVVDKIDAPKQYSKVAPEPYKTSTLQQDAINNLNWSAKKITAVAQMLYEGIDINGVHTALISYPRTDSNRYSDDFVSNTKQFIKEQYGKDYVSSKNYAQTTHKKDVVVQDAHEAIRVIDVSITPQQLKNVIEEDAYKLYNLIWKHSLASLMSDALYQKTAIWFLNNDNVFVLFHHELLFDGWQKIFSKDNCDEVDLTKFALNKKIQADEIEINQHETQPPARYTQASLIADLEKSGVGRPSTYSTMANIPLERYYATLDKKYYHVTSLGEEVAANLNKYFPEIITASFTKDMENRLDKITNNEENWKTWLLEFWPSLKEKAKNVTEEIKAQTKAKEPEYTGENCPECNSPLIYRFSKKTKKKFIGCSDFPKCKYIKSLQEPPKLLEEKCPLCNNQLIERKNKRGTTFIGCSNYPKCKYIKKEPSKQETKVTKKTVSKKYS